MNSSPQIVTSRLALRQALEKARKAGKRVGFVPTMGALHQGHLSLVRLVQSVSDMSVVSIFVNPTQFAPGEDLDAYPRTEDADIEKLAGLGCDIVYLPTAEEMYPDGSVTNVRVEHLSDLLDGRHRPHFFYGVTTVVARLFIHVQPDVAAFGEKDYQQLQIIRRMVRDLGFPVKVLGGPTIRDADGLAQSSRNTYLSAAEREIAPAMSAALHRAVCRIEAGLAIGAALEEAEHFIRAAGFDSVDYVSAVDPQDLQDLSKGPATPGAEGRLLAAARIGKTRLIDNAGFCRPA